MMEAVMSRSLIRKSNGMWLPGLAGNSKKLCPTFSCYCPHPFMTIAMTLSGEQLESWAAFFWGSVIQSLILSGPVLSPGIANTL